MSVSSRARAGREARVSVATIGVAACAASLLLAPASASAAGTPPPTPAPRPSAVGPAFIQWLAVSPAYLRTGLVMATGSAAGCSTDCTRLWSSHDGGATWRQAKAHGWTAGRFSIAVDGRGHEVIYSSGSPTALRSDDDGDTWLPAGPAGTPAVLPTYAADGGVVLAAGSTSSDTLIHTGNTVNVSGSGGQGVDMFYMPSPTYPSGGKYSPALVFMLDANSSQPMVARCTAGFRCSNAVVLPHASASPQQSAATVLLAPADYPQRGVVFADTPTGVDKSTDGGASFTPLSILSPDGAQATETPAMALAPGYRENGPSPTAYVAVLQLFMPASTPKIVPNYQQTYGRNHTSGGIYRTTDGGATWQPIATSGPFSGGAVALAAAPDGRLFAGYFDGISPGLVCSIDGGASWRTSCPAVGTAGMSGQSVGGGAQPCTSCTGSRSAGGDATAGSAGESLQGGGTPLGASVPAGTATSTGIGSRWTVVAFAILALVLAAASALRLRRRHRPDDADQQVSSG